MTDTPDIILNIESAEGQLFKINKKLVQKWENFADILHKQETGIMNPASSVRIAEISGKILRFIVEYGTNHMDDPDPPLVTEDLPGIVQNPSSLLSTWDKEFFTVRLDTIFEILKAADYLEYRLLVDSGCKALAGGILNTDIVDMSKMFHVGNIFAISLRQDKMNVKARPIASGGNVSSGSGTPRYSKH